MTTTEPKAAPTGRYSVAETARMLEIHRNTLLAHTNAGLIKCGYRRTNGRKFYSGMEILKYWRGQL